MGSKWQPRVRAVVVVLPHCGGCGGGAESSRCLGKDRKGEGVLELEPEKKKMERAAVVIMSETVPINVMLWPPAAIAFP